MQPRIARQMYIHYRNVLTYVYIINILWNWNQNVIIYLIKYVIFLLINENVFILFIMSDCIWYFFHLKWVTNYYLLLIKKEFINKKKYIYILQACSAYLKGCNFGQKCKIWLLFHWWLLLGLHDISQAISNAHLVSKLVISCGTAFTTQSRCSLTRCANPGW